MTQSRVVSQAGHGEASSALTSGRLVVGRAGPSRNVTETTPFAAIIARSSSK